VSTGRGRWAAATLAVAASVLVGCQDAITAPGACPAFCPQGEIGILDTLLPNSAEPLGSFDGYRLPHEADQMQVVGPGGPAESRALVVFYPFGKTLSTSDTTVRDTIAETDSIRFTFNVVRRNTNVSGVRVALHAIPRVTDSTATFTSTAPYFMDSTLIATFSVPDSLTTGTVAVTVVPGALAHYVPDSLQIGLGLRIVSPEPAFISLGTTDTIPAARVARFVQVDTSDGSKLVTRADSQPIYFHTFVADSAKVPTPQGLAVGGLQAARAFMLLNVPQQLLDSTLIVRATLLLPPAVAAFGAPGDTVQLRVQELGTDFGVIGPKSPLVQLSTDTARAGSVAIGSADTIRIDVTDVLRTWHNNPSLPHNVMLRLIPEAGSIDLLELAPSAAAGLQGALRITYGLPFRLPGR
jgi:hypothetical protein